jgi:hypothetical protein
MERAAEAQMTDDEWRAQMALINNEPEVARLRDEIAAACWRYLTRVREHGCGCELEISVNPISETILQ